MAQGKRRAPPVNPRKSSCRVTAQILGIVRVAGVGGNEKHDYFIISCEILLDGSDKRPAVRSYANIPHRNWLLGQSLLLSRG